MSVVVGQLYVNSPARVCNAYLLGDQIRLGQALTWVSAIIAAIWLAQAARVLIRREQAMLSADKAR